MNATDTAAIMARIDERLEATGKTDRQASIEAFNAAHTIRNMRKASKTSVDALEALAKVLDTTPTFLAFGVAADDRGAPAPLVPSMPPQAQVPVVFRVGAGDWVEAELYADAPLRDDVPVPPDPDYGIDVQFAVEVSGESINKVAPDGALLCCIDTRKTHRRPREGEIVIVEMKQDDGSRIARTAKRFHKANDGRFELWPDSHDPHYQEPIVLDPSEEPPEGTSIELIGIVTWIHAPVTRPGHSRHA